MLLSEGQMSDYKGAAAMLPAMPKAKLLLADKGYDADWFRAALAKRRIEACIPSKSNRKIAIPHDAVLYKQRHKIENMFGRLKDWRRIHTRVTGPHLWDHEGLNLRCDLACRCPSRIKLLLAASVSAVGMWATRLRCPSEAAYPQPSPPPRFCPCRRATPPSAFGCSSPGEGAENCKRSSRN
jgi:transposase